MDSFGVIHSVLGKASFPDKSLAQNAQAFLGALMAAKPATAEVVIDPRIAFGNPIVDGTGISTAVLAQRYKAGDSIDELADDFGLSRDAVEQAIRYEVIPLRKAA